MITLREEYIVCYAAGYPDPFPCATLEEAKRFARRHSFNHSIKKRVHPLVKRRLVSDYEDVR